MEELFETVFLENNYICWYKLNFNEFVNFIMSYTIKIDNKTRKAKSIVNMLKELAEDYPFLHIYEDLPEESDELMEELEFRYNEAKKNPGEGKSWEEVKANLMSK
jgi:hypothetical protein